LINIGVPADCYDCVLTHASTTFGGPQRVVSGQMKLVDFGTVTLLAGIDLLTDRS